MENALCLTAIAEPFFSAWCTVNDDKVRGIERKDSREQLYEVIREPAWV